MLHARATTADDLALGAGNRPAGDRLRPQPSADRHAADDVVQDCYCRLLAKAGGVRPAAGRAETAAAAVTNACINATTRRKPLFGLVRPNADDQADDPRTNAAAPDQTAARTSEGRLAALGTLPPPAGGGGVESARVLAAGGRRDGRGELCPTPGY